MAIKLISYCTILCLIFSCILATAGCIDNDLREDIFQSCNIITIQYTY